MPALRPGGRKQIVPSDPTTAGQRRGSRRHSELLNIKGIPRYDDLLTTRLLEQTPTVSLPMNTATKQARAIPWDIQPTVDRPSATHNMMADRIYEFIDGGFNQNGQTWDQLLGRVLHDSISIDTGALEFVPTDRKIEHPQTGERTHWLSEVYVVDGTIVSKNLNDKDQIPEPPEPAFYKWGNTPNVNAGIFDSGLYDSGWFDRFQVSRLLSGVRQRAVPMTRDEMAILETNSQPREISAYGRGIVQQVRPWAEILLNQDRANVRHFAEDEFSKGILNIGEQYQGEIDRFREYWKDEVQGKTDTKLPIVASDGTEFIPFQETLKELQYLESQNWYSKLVWLLFGESTSTVGLAEDANTATAEAQSEDVFWNTTMPRLKAIQEFINNEWLPKMRAYWIAEGELEFTFKFEEHPIFAEEQRKKRREDLNNSLTTPNEIRTEEDKDPLPWGDAPKEAVSAFSREHPEWVMENWGGVDNVPEASSDETGLFSHSPDGGSETDSKDLDASPAPAPSQTGNESEFAGSRSLNEPTTKQDSYTDYPDQASENAQMALDAREDTGNPNDCGRREGWMRANQLADREAISRETVGRMAAFRRHQDNAEQSDEEGRADCGWMMWKAWGGEAGIAWAERIVDEGETDGVAEMGTITLHKTDAGVWVMEPASDDLRSKFDDPCWEGYHMVGTDENGDPICVPDDEVAPPRDSEIKPFAGYDDFEDCVSDNQDKRDPEAYCGWLEEHTKDGSVDLKAALQSPEVANDALRNERAGELPDLTSIVDAGAAELGKVIAGAYDDLERELEQRWPEDGEKAATKDLAINFDSILDGVDLTSGLTQAITKTITEAMEEGADTEVNQIEDEIKERLGEEEAELVAAFNVEDTLAFERMQESAADDMVTVNDTIKESIRDTLVETAEDGAGLQEATERLRDEIDELSDSHARLVARTEALDASRHGSQALAESADAIGGKKWRASQDSRTRPWHDAMDGEVVAKDESFEVPSGWTGEPHYQPNDYPREAFVVGEDQKYNCRCVQMSVLEDDMPEDTRALEGYDALELRFADKHLGDAVLRLEYDLSHRKFEIREEYKERAGETFGDVWARLRSKHSKTAITDVAGVSKTTVGKWDSDVGV